MKRFPILWALAACLFGLAAPAEAAKKVVLVAGRPSHGPGDHEFNAGCKLLQKCLAEIPGVEPVFVPGGWPADESVFDGADTLVFFMDGGSGHPMIQGDRLSKLEALMAKGTGLVCMHYAVEVPKGRPGDAFLEWIGGYYETAFSTNPHWVAEIARLPEHPTTRGVKPFGVRDEWYFNMRFRPEMKGVTPLLIAKPDDATRQGTSSSPRGPYPHIVAAKGRDEILAWAVERPDGGRGIGFTGGHSHRNWGNDEFRKFIINSILWTAKMEVPSDGFPSKVTEADLEKNLDPKGARPKAGAQKTAAGAAK
ncbi:MAG: ThuA domain-containing protein [Isosphaeraceae bacterium]|nr:ThuA domain-containing protein [Isosphaeraceae bacterium]